MSIQCIEEEKEVSLRGVFTEAEAKSEFDFGLLPQLNNKSSCLFIASKDFHALKIKAFCEFMKRNIQHSSFMTPGEIKDLILSSEKMPKTLDRKTLFGEEMKIDPSTTQNPYFLSHEIVIQLKTRIYELFGLSYSGSANVWVKKHVSLSEADSLLACLCPFQIQALFQESHNQFCHWIEKELNPKPNDDQQDIQEELGERNEEQQHPQEEEEEEKVEEQGVEQIKQKEQDTLKKMFRGHSFVRVCLIQACFFILAVHHFLAHKQVLTSFLLEHMELFETFQKAGLNALDALDRKCLFWKIKLSLRKAYEDKLSFFQMQTQIQIQLSRYLDFQNWCVIEEEEQRPILNDFYGDENQKEEKKALLCVQKESIQPEYQAHQHLYEYASKQHLHVIEPLSDSLTFSYFEDMTLRDWFYETKRLPQLQKTHFTPFFFDPDSTFIDETSRCHLFVQQLALLSTDDNKIYFLRKYSILACSELKFVQCDYYCIVRFCQRFLGLFYLPNLQDPKPFHMGHLLIVRSLFPSANHVFRVLTFLIEQCQKSSDQLFFWTTTQDQNYIRLLHALVFFCQHVRTSNFGETKTMQSLKNVFSHPYLLIQRFKCVFLSSESPFLDPYDLEVFLLTQLWFQECFETHMYEWLSEIACLPSKKFVRAELFPKSEYGSNRIYQKKAPFSHKAVYNLLGPSWSHVCAKLDCGQEIFDMSLFCKHHQTFQPLSDLKDIKSSHRDLFRTAATSTSAFLKARRSCVSFPHPASQPHALSYPNAQGQLVDCLVLGQPSPLPFHLEQGKQTVIHWLGGYTRLQSLPWSNLCLAGGSCFTALTARAAYHSTSSVCFQSPFDRNALDSSNSLAVKDLDWFLIYQEDTKSQPLPQKLEFICKVIIDFIHCFIEPDAQTLEHFLCEWLTTVQYRTCSNSYYKEDFDLFMYWKLKDHQNILASLLPEFKLTPFSLSFVDPQTHIKHQLILRIYQSVEQVLSGFDLDSSCVGFDGSQFKAMPRFVRCLQTGLNMVQSGRQSKSFSSRLMKYFYRGVAICLPQLNKDKISLLYWFTLQAGGPKALHSNLQNGVSGILQQYTLFLNSSPVTSSSDYEVDINMNYRNFWNLFCAKNFLFQNNYNSKRSDPESLAALSEIILPFKRQLSDLFHKRMQQNDWMKLFFKYWLRKHSLGPLQKIGSFSSYLKEYHSDVFQKSVQKLSEVLPTFHRHLQTVFQHSFERMEALSTEHTEKKEENNSLDLQSLSLEEKKVLDLTERVKLPFIAWNLKDVFSLKKQTLFDPLLFMFVNPYQHLPISMDSFFVSANPTRQNYGTFHPSSEDWFATLEEYK